MLRMGSLLAHMSILRDSGYSTMERIAFTSPPENAVCNAPLRDRGRLRYVESHETAASRATATRANALTRSSTLAFKLENFDVDKSNIGSRIFSEVENRMLTFVGLHDSHLLVGELLLFAVHAPPTVCTLYF